MGMASPLYYTADMVRALPDDGNRYEVVYGELLVTPAPRLWHQELAFRLARAMTAFRGSSASVSCGTRLERARRLRCRSMCCSAQSIRAPEAH